MGRWFVLGAAVAMCWVVPACGDDEGSEEVGTGGDAATGGQGATATECDPAGDGVCQNETDCLLVESGQARSTASTCGIGCLDDDDEAQCGADCVVQESGLTAACAACYVAIVDCSRENCLLDCASDPDGAGCFTCQVDAGCRTAFDDCSGLSSGG